MQWTHTLGDRCAVPRELVGHGVVHAVAVGRDVLDGEPVAREPGEDRVRLDLPLAHDVPVGLLDALAALALRLLLLLAAPLRLARLRWRSGHRGLSNGSRSRFSRLIRFDRLGLSGVKRG